MMFPYMTFADDTEVTHSKVDKSEDEAIEQINQKDYAGRYKSDNRKVIKIGVSFSSEKRNIDEWKVE